MSRGELVLVGTPLGNLGDMSPRAIEALGEADVLAVEDTRRTGALLSHLGIPAPKMIVLNDHTEQRRVDELLGRVEAGQRVVVVSDAGMPGISDPGETLVAAAVQRGLPVAVIPGPTAAITALVASGIPAGRFCFEGFLPRGGAVRKERLAALANERRTMIFYEAPHRVKRTISDLEQNFGEERKCSFGRELTKLHEQFWHGTLEEAQVYFDAVEPRGEFVLIVEGAPPPAPPTEEEIVAAVTSLVNAGVSKSNAASQVAEQYGISRRLVYNLTATLS